MSHRSPKHTTFTGPLPAPAPRWGAAHEAALERAKAAPAPTPPNNPTPLTPSHIGQRARRDREDAANPPSPEVIKRRERKRLGRERARDAKREQGADRGDT